MGLPNQPAHISCGEIWSVHLQGAQGKPKPYGLRMLEDRNVNTCTEERLCAGLSTLPSRSLGVRLQALALRPWTALAVHLT